jgi:hypothetical protein
MSPSVESAKVGTPRTLGLCVTVVVVAGFAAIAGAEWGAKTKVARNMPAKKRRLLK